MGVELSTGKAFSRLFGRRNVDHNNEISSENVINCIDSAPRSPYELAQTLLMNDISNFILNNMLTVSAANLISAHAALSGSDAVLAKKIADLQAAGLPVTQDWLDQQLSINSPEAGLGRMIVTLENTLEHFSKSSRTVRDAASIYGRELITKISTMADVHDDSGLVALRFLAQEMSSTTQRFAEEILRSEREVIALRRELVKARRDAHIDHLTGLPNRRAFESLLNHQYREARLNSEHLSVAFCDIDHFKRINDVHGHEAGDRILAAIAKALSRISDDNCHVARHGGEEFVMLFRNETLQDAWAKLDAVRANFSERNFINRATDVPIGKITFSGGIADMFDYPNARAALRAADEALYCAKSEGRDRILFASPTGSTT